MPCWVKTVALLAAFGVCVPAIAPAATATTGAPTGAWRTTNQCFLAAFLLTEDGRADTVYLTGERDEGAAWTWDGTTLKITSKTFDLDTFSGKLNNDRIQADYVWHDLDKDELHAQSCVFERLDSNGA